MPATFSSSNSYDPNGLLVGENPVISRQITLITGQNLTRGAVLGKITASGKYTLSLSASADGSQVPDCVLAEDTNATAADKLTVAYFVAGVNESKLTIGTGHTAASIKEGLRVKDIHLLTVQTMY